jgi:hypothetical protein
MSEEQIYRIIRFTWGKKSRTIKRNLTLSEAQAWCARRDTSSHSVGDGSWFDGYDYMKGYKAKGKL